MLRLTSQYSYMETCFPLRQHDKRLTHQYGSKLKTKSKCT